MANNPSVHRFTADAIEDEWLKLRRLQDQAGFGDEAIEQIRAVLHLKRVF
jgi:hypothetical protein